MSFAFHGEWLAYEASSYNDSRLNERAVEIPIARAWVARHGLDLEVGRVLCHYGIKGHRTVDRYEPGADNIDVFDITGHHPTVVSISTVEHVRWDEEPVDPDGAIRAIEHLVTHSDRLLITVGLGQHPTLDAYLMTGPAPRSTTLVQDGDQWHQTPRLEWRPYGESTIWAASVWIGEWTP